MFGIDDAILGSIGSSLLGGAFAAERQSNAQDFSASQYASRYQTTVKDMEAAGLNPMLAYSQGVGSSPSGSVANAQVGDVGQVINQTKIANAQAANLAADIENKSAQGELYKAQAAAQYASASQSTAQLGQIDATVNKLKAETNNLPLEGRRLEQLVYTLSEQANLAHQQQLTQVQQREQMEAMIRKIKSETNLLDLDIEAAKSLDNLGRTSKQLEPIVNMLKMFLRR